jgi:hypothetical protein
MMNIMRFSSCTAANQVRFWRVQSRMTNWPLSDFARLVQVFELEADAGRPFEAEDLLGILLVQQHEAAVVLEMARVEGAHHRHLLQARQHARRRDLPARRDQGHRIAFAHPELARQLDAQHDAELARHQPRQRVALHRRRQVGHLGFARRVDAAHQRAAHLVAARHQRLRRHERRGPDHLRIAPGFGHGAVRIGQHAAARPVDLDVRNDAQHAVAHFLLEAVHHREHDDQRRHAQGDAQHRHAGDEGDESVAPGGAPRAGVAPAQGQFVGDLHAWAAIVASRTIAACRPPSTCWSLSPRAVPRIARPRCRDWRCPIWSGS